MAGSYRSGGHSRVGPTKQDAQGQLRDPLTDTAAPADLTAEAAAHWHYYAPILVLRELWTASARDTLRCYVEALELRDRLQAAIAAVPLAQAVTTIDGAGNEQATIKAHPLIAQLRAVRLECRQHANDLCLSPASALRSPGGNAGKAEPTKWEVLTRPHSLRAVKRPAAGK